MEDTNIHRPKSASREARLLIVTISISAIVLLLLAQLRFSETTTNEILDLHYQDGHGTIVGTVAPGSLAASAGIISGDLLIDAGGIQAPSPAQVKHLLDELSQDQHLLLTIQRNGRQKVVALAAPTFNDTATLP